MAQLLGATLATIGKYSTGQVLGPPLIIFGGGALMYKGFQGVSSIFGRSKPEPQYEKPSPALPHYRYWRAMQRNHMLEDLHRTEGMHDLRMQNSRQNNAITRLDPREEEYRKHREKYNDEYRYRKEQREVKKQKKKSDNPGGLFNSFATWMFSKPKDSPRPKTSSSGDSGSRRREKRR